MGHQEEEAPSRCARGFKEMEKFLAGEEFEQAEGYVPPTNQSS